MNRFETIENVINEYVIPALGTYADDYDLDAIARDITHVEGRLLVVDEDAFWGSVEAHDLTISA